MMADDLQIACIQKTEWQMEHQGPLVDIRAEVWYCGDEWCNCTQAQIVARFRNLFDSRWIVPRLLWEGEFYTDGRFAAAEDELTAKQADLEATEPEMASRIIWPEVTADV